MSTKRVAAEANLSLPLNDMHSPPRKLRKKSVTAKSLGITKGEFATIKALPLKRELKTYVKKLAALIEKDWYDGVDEQAVALKEWAAALQKPMQSVVDIGVGRGLAFVQCHDVLKVIGDSWRDVRSCRSRVHAQQMLNGFQMQLLMPWGETVMFTKFGEICPLRDMVGFVWRMLLRTAAAARGRINVDDSELFQAIKDATDNGVLLSSAEVGKELTWEENGAAMVGNDVARPEPKPDELDALVAMKDRWMRLDSTIRTFRPRRVIDRRQTEKRARAPSTPKSNDETTPSGCGADAKDENIVPPSMSSANSAAGKTEGVKAEVEAEEMGAVNYTFEDDNENAAPNDHMNEENEIYVDPNYGISQEVEDVVAQAEASTHLPVAPEHFWSKHEEDGAETVVGGVTESSAATPSS